MTKFQAGVIPVLRSNYITASLGASVGSPPGRAVCELVLAYAEPFLHWQRRSRGPLISLSAYASSSSGDWPSASQRLDLSLPPTPAHLHTRFVQGLVCGLAIGHIGLPGPGPFALQ